MTDTYVYSDGSNVLINKMGIRDRAALQRAEYRLAAANAPIALMYADNARSLNEVVWRGVHKRLFADLYGWSGKFRTVDLSKGRTVFAPPAALHGWADRRVLPAFRRAAKSATTDIEFAAALAACWGELNFLHPFREGNGRPRSSSLRSRAATAVPSIGAVSSIAPRSRPPRPLNTMTMRPTSLSSSPR